MAGYSIGKNWDIETNTKPMRTQGSKPGNKLLMQDVGIYLMTPILLGVIGGVFLDKKFDTKPIWTLALIFFGMAASFYNLWRLLKTNGRT